jgi:signal transduction histidine kinase
MLLVFSTTLFALVLLGVILVSVIWTSTTAAQQPRALATAKVAAAGIEDAVEAGVSVTDEMVQGYVRDEAVLTVTLPDGRVVTSASPPSGSVYRAEATAGEVTVVAEIPTWYIQSKLVQQTLLVVLTSLLALGVATVVAMFYARRLTQPLEDFAEVAGRIATGDRRPLGRRYGVPELDAVAEVLDAGVSGFNDLLENERRVTTEASHQLRTPLTALSLRLEEILASDDLDEVHAEATAALGQVERLTGVVDEVVGVSRGTRAVAQEPIDLDALVSSQATEWWPAFHAAHRSLVRLGSTGLVARGLPGAQGQALATLIENSLVHGGGTTSLRLRASGSWVVLEVSDEGPGVPAQLETRVFERNVSGADSSGLGLPLARTLVMADGGRLEMLSARPAVFAMFLPAHDPGRVEPALSPAPAPADTTQTVVASVSSPAATASSGNTQRR